MHTVLVVDDDECFQYLCKTILERSGQQFNILTAYDGEEALQVLRTSEVLPDLILLDINMPRMNGHEFLNEYAKLAPADVPVVAMLTSSNHEQDRVSALAYSFVKDYLVKPLRKEDIGRLVTMAETLKMPPAEFVG